MIVVYPLVTSKTISSNVIPGICKALEHYLLIHKLDKIIDSVNEDQKKQQRGSAYGYRLKASRNGKLVAESVITEQGKGGKGGGQQPSPTQPPPTSPSPNININIGGQSQPETPSETQGRDRKKREEEQEIKSRETAKVSNVERASMTVEPTWVKVDTPQGTKMIGIKVVPFLVDNDTPLLRLLTLDRFRKSLDKTVQWQSRRIIRQIYRIANVAWKYTIGVALSFTGLVGSDLKSGTITGNWKKDIVLGQTDFNDNMFLLINRNDFSDEFFNAKGLKDLFKLFWPSIVVADEVNKTASFCMADFKGLCSIVNYQYLFASIGRQAAEAYDTVEDVRRASGPFNIKRGRFKDMIQDSSTKKLLDKYSKDSLIREGYLSEYDLSESAIIGDVKRNYKEYSKTISSVISAVKNGDTKGFVEIAKSFKGLTVNPKEIANEASKRMKDFSQYQALAKRVFENSIKGVPPQVIDIGASIVATSAIMSKTDPKQALVDNIKKIVTKTRTAKASKSDDEEWSREVLIAFVFAIISVCVIGVLATITFGFIKQVLVGIGPSIIAGVETFFLLLFILSILKVVGMIGS